MTRKNVTETVSADAQGIAKAAAILERGGLVAVPTETVYGLAARADSAEAVAKIYAAKGRPSFNPLIVHVANLEQAKRFAEFSTNAEDLTRQYWPGPLTLVLRLKSDVRLAPAVTAELRTVAVRSPAHPAMRNLLASVDFPLAAPSANRSGFISPTSAAHVLASLDGRLDLILDGGPSLQGLESTIIAVRDDGSLDVLRPGPIGLFAAKTGALRSLEAPGQLASHYAPGKPVRLNVIEVAPDDFVIGFGEVPGDCTLSKAGDLTEAASNLYDCLHQAAASNKPNIAIAPIPEEGIGVAINDRLRRAATPTDEC